MNTDTAPEVVEFITLEEGDDLIVSFAIGTGVPGDVLSLTLLRTPKFEFALPADECGVVVSHESFPREEDDPDLLRRITMAPPVVTIETTDSRYELDVSKVDRSKLQAAQGVLKQMNFDNRFVLELA